MKLLTTIARYLVGALFIFSGAIKINDPAGTQIKLEEYFTVFSQDIAPFFDALKPASLFLSILLSTLEVVLGVALILKYKENIVVTLLLAMIVFFTFLTFYSAYFNKVTDCGCFGDAIKLTPWQSFIKDIILLFFIVVLFINRKKNEISDGFKRKTIILSGFMIFSLVVCFRSVAHLPRIDFRAYKVGTHIPTDMVPPANDPMAVPKISNFAIWGDTADYTFDILQGKKLVIVIHDATKTNKESIQRIIGIIRDLESQGVEVVAVTASAGEDFEVLRHAEQLAVPYYYSDMTLLKTMVRSNPGLVLLQDGEVMEKWHYNDIPSDTDVMRKFW